MGTGGKVVSIFGGAHLDSRTSGADLINTPLQRGVVRARDGRKPFQRFPGLRYRNGPLEGRRAWWSAGFHTGLTWARVAMWPTFRSTSRFSHLPVQISLTPRFSGVWCARDGRKPFQRFPGLRCRNGPFNDPSWLPIADQEALHLLVERCEHRWQAD